MNSTERLGGAVYNVGVITIRDLSEVMVDSEKQCCDCL